MPRLSLPRIILASLALLSLLASSGRAADPPADASDDVRVMSFNVRFGTARDGDNHWDRRKDFLVQTIEAFAPDLLGTQETIGFQRDFIAAALAGYDHHGVGRNDGQEDGEMMALFYRRDRFEKLDAGHFWLSETPAVVGSQSWDSSLPRMASWVKLRDRQLPDSRPILFVNTHFDHRGATARLESSRLIRRQIAELGADCDVVLTGDFNADPTSPPYQALFAAEGDQPSPVVDSFRIANPRPTAAEGTFSGFRGDAIQGARIDWVGVSPSWTVVAATIDRTAVDGRTPSDHFPVTAILRR